MPPLAGRRPAARRIAGALFELGGDALAIGLRVVTGRGASAPATLAPPPDTAPAPGMEPAAATGHAADARPASAAQAARRAAAAEEAAARLDAARERLRATIAPPSDEEDPTAPA